MQAIRASAGEVQVLLKTFDDCPAIDDSFDENCMWGAASSSHLHLEKQATMWALTKCLVIVEWTLLRRIYKLVFYKEARIIN